MACEVKRLEDVAEVLDGRCGPVRGAQRILRSGPYRLYVETGCIPFDDFAFEGPHLLLGSVCNVESPQGTLQVTKATGRFSVTDLYHVVACGNEDDTEYLRLVLSRIPARDYADMSGQTVRLSPASLRSIHVPWPDEQARRAFVRFMGEREDRHRSCLEQARALFEQGAARCREACSWEPRRIADVCDVREGRSLEADERRGEGRLPVVCSQGVVGRTDEAGVDGPCLVLGQAGQYILGYRMTDGAFPLSDSLALTMKDGESAPLEAVALGLAAQGVRPRLRVVDRTVEALALPLAQVPDMKIGLPPAAEADTFRLEAQELLERVDGLEREAADARRAAEDAARMLIAGGDGFLEPLAEHLSEPAGREGLERGEAIGPHSYESTAGDSVESASEDAGFGESLEDSSCQADPRPPETAVRERLRDLVSDILSSLRRAGETATSFDAAWELLPLLFLRSVDEGARWKGILAAPEPAQACDRALEQLADGEPALRFLAQLTSASSNLDAAARLHVLQGLDALPDGPLGGGLVRWIALEYAVEPASTGGRPSERRTDAPCPAAVASLIVDVARAFIPKARSAFDPCAREGSVLARLKAECPDIVCAGQVERFSDALAAALAARCEGWAFGPDALRVGDALQEDAFAGAHADIVASILPPNQGEWTDARPDAHDVRWAFGVPPRNKANLAWLQHAHAHRAPGGYAVLAAADALLHEKRGCEPAVRAALIASGCVRAVIALPGGLFDDDRPPLSLVVLGDPRDGECETLFVDALECGAPRVSSMWPPRRMLDAKAAKRIADVVEAWARTGACDPVPGFAGTACKSDIEKLGDLTPWSFV